MIRTVLLLASITFCLLFSSTAASALTVQNVNAPVLAPAEQGVLEIEVKNIFDVDVKDVSLSLDLSQVPFSSVGSSEESVDRIKDDEKETFFFTLRVDSSAKPGNYKVPYILTYHGATTPKKGTLGIHITAQPELSLSASTDHPVLNEKGKLSLKVINKGKGEASFVSVKIVPAGFMLLSEDQTYIGSISSDDFETATFDVIFTDKNALLKGILEYANQDNKKSTQLFALSLQLYTHDEAIERGILVKSNTTLYVGIVVLFILLWILWSALRRHRRMNKSLHVSQGRQ